MNSIVSVVYISAHLFHVRILTQYYICVHELNLQACAKHIHCPLLFKAHDVKDKYPMPRDIKHTGPYKINNAQLTS